MPSSISPGQYLVRVEQIGLHVVKSPQYYVSCGQVQVTGGGSASPSTVSIPGYVSASDPGLTVNIFDPVPTAYKVPVSILLTFDYCYADVPKGPFRFPIDIALQIACRSQSHE